MNLPKLLSGRRRRPAWSDRTTEAEEQDPGQHAYLNWVATTVSEYGWAVSGNRGDDQTPPWAYSVGIWLNSQGPELIVCGLPLENAASIINAIGARAADGADIGPGVVLDDVCQAPLGFRPVEMSWRTSGLLAVSDSFYGMVRPPYLQVVWPDRNECFPGDPGFQPGFAGLQPLLWLPRDDNPPVPLDAARRGGVAAAPYDSARLASLFQGRRVLRPELARRRRTAAGPVTGAWILDPQVGVYSGRARSKSWGWPEGPTGRITPLWHSWAGIRTASVAAGVDDRANVSAESVLELLAPGHDVCGPLEV